MPSDGRYLVNGDGEEILHLVRRGEGGRKLNGVKAAVFIRYPDCQRRSVDMAVF